MIEDKYKSRIMDIVCDINEVKNQCPNCKEPLCQVRDSTSAMRYICTDLLLCKSCNKIYFLWDVTNGK